MRAMNVDTARRHFDRLGLMADVVRNFKTRPPAERLARASSKRVLVREEDGTYSVLEPGRAEVQR